MIKDIKRKIRDKLIWEINIRKKFRYLREQVTILDEKHEAFHESFSEIWSAVKSNLEKVY